MKIIKPLTHKLFLLCLILPLVACSENKDTLAAQSDPAVFTTTVRINENMPEFTFHRTLRDYVPNFEFSDNERYISIKITDAKNNLIQEIDEIIQGGYGEWMTADWDIFDIRFDDLNFDGYIDMWLVSAVNPGTASGTWNHFWLWDYEINQFVRNEQLENISGTAWFYVNQTARQIYVGHRLHNVHHLQEIYEYHNNEFILVKTVEYEGWGEHWEITYTDVLTGGIIVETVPFYD